MKQVWRDALLKTDNIDGILLGWKNRASTRVLGKYLPIKEVNRDRIELEVDLQTRGGMTPLSSIGAEAPVVRFSHSRSSIEYEIPIWKEKTLVTPKEIYDLRKLGTHDQYVTAQELMNRKIQLLEERLQNRFEFMRREFLFDKQVTAQDAVGNTVVYSYPNHPDYMNLTAATPWDDPTANVHEEILEWRDEWFEHSTYLPAEVLLPFGALRKMAFINEVKDKAAVNWASIKDGYTGIDQILNLAFGGIPIREVRDRISYTTQLAANASASATSVVLRQTEGLVAGMKLRLVNIMGPAEVVIVTSVSGNTVNFTGTPLQHDYNANDGAIYHIWTLPLDKMLIMGGQEVAIDTSGAQPKVGSYISEWAEITSTRAIDSNMMNPRPGLYSKTVDKSDEEVAYISYMIGGHFLPRLFDGTGWMVCTIF